MSSSLLERKGRGRGAASWAVWLERDELVNVAVYTTPTCPYCRQVKDFLSRRGVPFAEYDVSVDRVAAQEMMRKSGQMGVPVITVDEQVVVGFDRPRLERLLADTGNKKGVHFGVRVADARKVAPSFGLAPADGALVGKVASPSVGRRLGLQQGDIITELNSRPIHNAHDLEDALSTLAAGSRVTIAFLRGEETQTSEIIV